MSFSFEDLKTEFRAIEVEIKDKAEEIVQLRQALIETQKWWSAKEKESTGAIHKGRPAKIKIFRPPLPVCLV